MDKFGTLKIKILQKLTDAYVNENKREIKKILNEIKKNNDFKETYLFYEEIENKYIEDKESAKLYLEEVRPLLIDKLSLIGDFCKSLDKKMGKVTVVENELYGYLDTLLEERKLQNIDKKINAEKRLIEHLTTKKNNITIKEGLSDVAFTENEKFLHAVLTNNFNVLYNNTLNEEEKTELKSLLSMSNDELTNSFNTLKEEINGKLGKMLTEEKNDMVIARLNETITEINTMGITKHGYYKLSHLKNGI